MITRDETSEVPYRGNGVPSREAAAPAEQAPAREDAEDTGPPDFVGHLTEAGTHLARLARVRTDRAEHALRRRAVGLVALVFALLATSILCIQGALLLSRGLAGTLGALAGSTHALSAATTGPAQVSFSPSGRAIVITEKATNKVDELRLNPYTGRPASFTAHDSSGQTPFGFAINGRGQVIVSEAFGGAAGASKVSSYQLGGISGLTVKSASIPDTEGAACWVVLGGDRAFVSNTASGSISTYSVAYDGTLALTAARAADTGTGSKPTDMALTRDGRYLYVLESGTHTLGITRVGSGGSLTVQPDAAGLPMAAAGLAAL